MTVGFPPENLMFAPFELGCRPARSSRIPAFAISSLYFVIAAISRSSGIMNRIDPSLPRMSRRCEAHGGDRGQPRLRHHPRIAAVLRDPQAAGRRAEGEPLAAL